jgi:NAD(P)-dependent dehydrogenase (short-subunit alcohol dehydrogenase family)
VADLLGRTIILSGVGEGLGRETALVAAREGGNVVLGARTESVLAAIAKEVEAAGGQAAYRRCDISKAEDCQGLVDAALERFGQIDGLINIAAFDSLFGGLGAADADFADWKAMFDVNLYGTLTLTRCALPALEQTQGSIVMVSSQTQHHPPHLALQMAYASSKSALTGAMRHMAQEIGPRGIRVNEVAPGWMWGPPVEGYVKILASSAGITPEEQLTQMTAHMPLRRMATDGEVAESLVFFASPRSAGITGQTLLINAGEVVK